MKINCLSKAPWLVVGAFLLTVPMMAQKRPTKAKPPQHSVVFAVLDSGKRVEPIASIAGGKLGDVSTGEGEGKKFATSFYKPGSAYAVIFGGVADGKLSIVKSNIGTECGGSSAETKATPVKAKLSSLVMALATNAKLKADEVGYRRRPTTEERAEIEKLVRAEFTKQGTPDAAVKNLKYHNLTAVDLDRDDKAEFVGSYWIAPSADERRLLFFIAGNDAAGKLGFMVNDYSLVKPDDVMTSDVKDLDSGVGHELLIDVLDVDGDGVREIFTIGQAFEGNNYHVYKRAAGKWSKVHETYSYRCAY
jgi:hypothetical protein